MIFPHIKAMLGAAGNGSGIEFVGGRVTSSGGSTITTTISSGLTGGIGTSAEEGDLVVVVQSAVGDGGYLSSNLNLTINTSGFTELVELFDLSFSSSNGYNVSVHHKFIGVVPDSDVIGAGYTGSLGGVQIVMVFRGVDQSTPFDVAHQATTGGGSTHVNGPAITPVTPGAVILVMGGSSGNVTHTVTGFEHDKQVTRNTTYHDSSAVAAWKYWTSGTFNPPVFTGSASNSYTGWGAITLALRPA